MITEARTAMTPSARRLHTMLLGLIAAAAIMVTLTVPATARAAPSGPRGSAFVWANQPSSASYIPNQTYQWNSQHPFTAVNTITRTGIGSYTVRLPYLGAASGTVLVTAYGPDTNNCKVLSWHPSGAAQLVNVRCFTATGVPTDTKFTMSYANGTGFGYDMAYVWADQPTAASYVPSQPYQANSSGATNQIQHLSTGYYMVKLPGLGRLGGHVQVTAYGPGPERCKVVSWGPHGTEQDIQVLCNTSNGTPADTKFTLTYVRNGNVLGAPVCCHPDGNRTDYALADQPTAASSYTPNLAYQFNGSAQHITISPLATGSYAVHVPDTLNNGNVQVTAVGNNSAQCKVNSWTPATGIRVLCFRSGSPIDSRFDVSFVGPFVIG